MSSTVRARVAIGIVVVVAACDTSPREVRVVSEPNPITIETSFTGKY